MLVKYSMKSKEMHRNNMEYLWNCLELGVLEAL
jgi:hypothetical protein